MNIYFQVWPVASQEEMRRTLLESRWLDSVDARSFMDTTIESIYTEYTISLIDSDDENEVSTSLPEIDNDEERRCIVCTETIRVLVQMNNCNHICVCLNCIRKIWSDRPEGRKARCPLCRSEFCMIRRLNC